MNKIGSLVRIVAKSQMRGPSVVRPSYVRQCIAHKNSRFFSTEEEEIEKKATKDEEPKRYGPYNLVMDRRGINISPEASIEYMKSDAYKQTYGPHRVWELFRRNFPGQWSPFRPRHTCMIEGRLWTTNPCPVCRDEYLVLHYTNLDLLNQFIRPQTGYVFENTVICLCTEQYENLLVAINLAKNYGLLTFEMPLRTYDYKDYYKDYNPELYKCSHDH